MNIHKHLCKLDGQWIIEGPMNCPNFNNKDHIFGICSTCYLLWVEEDGKLTIDYLIHGYWF